MTRDQVLLYKPLIVACGIAVVMAAALDAGGAVPFMRGIMGALLLQLATLQVMNLSGFATLFAKYDPLAKAFPVYGYLYPAIGALLGALYLSGLAPVAAGIGTLAVFGINTAGVVRVLRGGESVQCGCAGSAFTLPVGRVTLAENAAMIAMAAAMMAGW